MIELYNADCLEKMKDIPNGSIDCVITSPPYDSLRKNSQYDDVFDFAGIAKLLYQKISEGG